ncbi:nickel ABC transporter, substrate-binding protein [Escherichia coli]|uniref:Nickel ABC transporter, substrate-binding protein n=1 Tax=Escherichia coli TaxID=562 RepID=A0A376MK63_ECOLX|nr:nickel ABC transporter, substrate-binding protein [Escherichia coli]
MSHWLARREHIYARQRDGRFGIFSIAPGARHTIPHAFLSSMRVPSHADFQAQQGLADKPLIDKEIGEVLATHDETPTSGAVSRHSDPSA